MTLDELNALPVADAEAELLACCASRRWAAAIVRGRPYGGPPELRDAAAVALDGLDWADIQEALGAHPRIGERADGHERADGREREASWSRGEQSSVDAANAQVKAALVEGNRLYEERFDHVFLVCATGLSATEMLAALERRLVNPPETEQAVVREELGKIMLLRLAKLLDAPAARNRAEG